MNWQSYIEVQACSRPHGRVTERRFIVSCHTMISVMSRFVKVFVYAINRCIDVNIFT